MKKYRKKSDVRFLKFYFYILGIVYDKFIFLHFKNPSASLEIEHYFKFSL